jgi:hypothetical protein
MMLSTDFPPLKLELISVFTAQYFNVDVGGLYLSARRLMYEEEYYRSITSTSLLIVPDAG